MSKILGTVFDAYEMLGGEVRKGDDGKVENRSTAYNAVKHLPDRVKVRIGSSLRVHLPKLREWVDEGGNRTPVVSNGSPLESGEQQTT